MARRSDHTREELRSMMLAAARKLIAADGRHNLSARKIANEIGYTAGTIYLVFKDLDDMLVHVNAQTVDELHEHLATARDVNSPPAEQLKALANAYIDYAARQRELWELAMQHRLTDDRGLPDWFHEKVGNLLTLVLDAIKPVVKDPHQQTIMATALWSGVHGACVLSQTGRLKLVGRDDLDEIIDSLISQYVLSFENS